MPPDRHPGRLRLGILDLLEDLAHAGFHERSLLGRSFAVAPSRALRFPWIQLFLFAHGQIVAPRCGDVNTLGDWAPPTWHVYRDGLTPPV